MGFDLVGRDLRAKDGSGGGPQGCHDGPMVMLRLARELGESPSIERPMLAVLEIGPKIRRGGARVATRMHEEAAQDLLVAHQPSEAVDIGRVVDVVALPVKTHHEVMADDAGGDFALTRIEAEALKDLIGNGHASFCMALDPAGLGDVMKEEDRVEKRRGLGAEDDGAIALIDVRLAGVDCIQFHQAAQRMHVGRPAMVEFELHEAVQPGKLGDQAIQEAVLAKRVQGAVDATAFGEHRTKGATGFLRSSERRRQ